MNTTQSFPQAFSSEGSLLLVKGDVSLVSPETLIPAPIGKCQCPEPDGKTILVTPPDMEGKQHLQASLATYSTAGIMTPEGTEFNVLPDGKLFLKNYQKVAQLGLTSEVAIVADSQPNINCTAKEQLSIIPEELNTDFSKQTIISISTETETALTIVTNNTKLVWLTDEITSIAANHLLLLKIHQIEKHIFVTTIYYGEIKNTSIVDPEIGTSGIALFGYKGIIGYGDQPENITTKLQHNDPAPSIYGVMRRESDGMIVAYGTCQYSGHQGIILYGTDPANLTTVLTNEGFTYSVGFCCQDTGMFVLSGSSKIFYGTDPATFATTNLPGPQEIAYSVKTGIFVVGCSNGQIAWTKDPSSWNISQPFPANTFAYNVTCRESDGMFLIQSNKGQVLYGTDPNNFQYSSIADHYSNCQLIWSEKQGIYIGSSNLNGTYFYIYGNSPTTLRSYKTSYRIGGACVRESDGMIIMSGLNGFMLFGTDMNNLKTTTIPIPQGKIVAGPKPICRQSDGLFILPRTTGEIVYGYDPENFQVSSATEGCWDCGIFY